MLCVLAVVIKLVFAHEMVPVKYLHRAGNVSLLFGNVINNFECGIFHFDHVRYVFEYIRYDLQKVTSAFEHVISHIESRRYELKLGYTC